MKTLIFALSLFPVIAEADVCQPIDTDIDKEIARYEPGLDLQRRKIHSMESVASKGPRFAASVADRISKYKKELEEMQAAAKRNAEDAIALRMRTYNQCLARNAVEERKNERIQQRIGDPKWMTPVLSGRLCKHQIEKKTALDEISKENHYARSTGGGMIDKSKMYELQGNVREADEGISTVSSQARDMKIKLVSCREKVVSLLTICMIDNEQQHCSDPPFSDYLELAE